MAFEKVDYIWMNGRMVPWDDAKIHVLSHVVHYGTSIFEGMRVYKTSKGPAAFRLNDHTTRLFNSAKIYRMQVPYTKDEINDAILNVVGANRMEECYVRPLVYRGYNQLGVDPSPCPVDVAIAVWVWGKYLGPEALEKGVSVCVSSWARPAPNTLPLMAKAAANYMNSQLVKMEAMQHGYAEGIALDVYGHVSEGSAQNIFIVRRGVLFTPPLSASVLPGITRNSIIQIAQDRGYRVEEQDIPREALYLADEVFFTGSAAEVTPVASVDKITVGEGKCGPITRELQKAFFDIIEGRAEDTHNWLTLVPKYNTVGVK
ncbi:branched chain amino acid aminotransferase [candidate division GN15 bacterium]|uniref:Branched-chain-amino-acid aminotransferase n=1 Tax=candidate division GN15 bacterium TaxID=2072418 RepID=A0A855X3Q4_9BACT|nr:MAG: branched chain amino acid aminotransferase [candidate division GN15 bacterium]